MPSQSDSRIEERLIGDALADHMDRIDDTRNLWPDVRDRLSQRRRSRFSVLAKVMTATAVVLLLATLVALRPWSFFEEAVSPFAAVAHAYDGLIELETVRYRIDSSGSLGNQYSTLLQVDLVNRIEYSVETDRLDPGSGSLKSESILINGKAYMKTTTSDGEPPVAFYRLGMESEDIIEYEIGVWVFDGEVKSWNPFGSLGGLPWRREDAEEQFDEVQLVEVGEIEGQPAVRYRASRTGRSTASDVHGLRTMVIDLESLEPKIAEIVHRGTDDFAVYVDTVDLWVTSNEGRLIQVDWMKTEQSLSSPLDVDEGDGCQGLGEFVNIEYLYRRAADAPTGFQVYGFESPPDSDQYRLMKIICWNEDRSEARIVWGRSQAEEFGGDYWRRLIYSFTAFNEPLDLPADLPE